MNFKSFIESRQGFLISALVHFSLFGVLLYLRPDYRMAIKEYIDVSVFDLKQEIKSEVQEHIDEAPKPIQEIAKKIPTVAKMVAPQARFDASNKTNDDGPIKEYIDNENIGLGGVGKLPDEGSESGSDSGAVNGGGTLADLAKQKFDRELWDMYGNEIRKRCLNHLHYPPQAIKNGWQGEADILIKISASGDITYEVVHGSKYLILDKQAMEMVRKAAAEFSLPEKYRGKQIQIIIPVAFVIK